MLTYCIYLLYLKSLFKSAETWATCTPFFIQELRLIGETEMKERSPRLKPSRQAAMVSTPCEYWSGHELAM